MTIEACQIVGAIGLVRAGVPLRVRASVERVEDVDGRFDRLVAEPEPTLDFELQVLRILVADLAIAARRSLEPQAIGERIRLRGAVGEPDGGWTVDRIGCGQLNEE